ncbi:MAG: hypothetical protein N3C60_02500 [Calditerrivibrio sp.]|nr:hypothetical protein [Calditerrivibrio sp.]
MRGLSSLFLGLIVLLGGKSSEAYDSRVVVKGDIFSAKTRYFVGLLEKEGHSYAINADVSDGDVLVDLEKEEVTVKGKKMNFGFGYGDILKAVLAERKNDWDKGAYLIKKNKELSEVVDVIKNNNLRYILYDDKRSLMDSMEKLKKDKKIDRYYFLLYGEGKRLLEDMILPMTLLKDNMKIYIIALTKKICDVLADQDYLLGFRRTELYSFISCLEVDAEERKEAGKVENDVYSVIIINGVKRMLDREMKGSLEEKNVYKGEEMFGLKGYFLNGGKVVPVDLIKQIELK